MSSQQRKSLVHMKNKPFLCRNLVIHQEQRWRNNYPLSRVSTIREAANYDKSCVFVKNECQWMIFFKLWNEWRLLRPYKNFYTIRSCLTCRRLDSFSWLHIRANVIIRVFYFQATRLNFGPYISIKFMKFLTYVQIYIYLVMISHIIKKNHQYCYWSVDQKL